MSSDLKNFMGNRRVKVKEKQRELKTLTDEELMQRDIDLWDSLESQHKAEHVLHEAILAEVNRRAMAACWFWRRWIRPIECKKWLEHKKKTNEKALSWYKKFSSLPPYGGDKG